MKYKTLFFDLDDTLLDTVRTSGESLREIYTEYQFDNYFPTFEDFFAKYLPVNLKLWDLYEHDTISKETLKTERFAKTLEGIVDLSLKKSAEINEDFMYRSVSKKNIIDGVIEILDYLYPKYPMYIVSNGFKEIQDKKMESAGIKSYFKKVILSDHVGKNKPHPIIFTHALSQANTSPNSTLMIGDNIKTDIIGAKNCNIDQVWYNPRKVVDEAKVNPTHVIQNMKELQQIL